MYDRVIDIPGLIVDVFTDINDSAANQCIFVKYIVGNSDIFPAQLMKKTN